MTRRLLPLMVLALPFALPELASAQACPPGQSCVIVVEQTGTTGPVVTAPAPGYAPGYAAPAPQPIEETRTRPQWGVVIPGAIMLGVGWVLNWVGAIPIGVGHAFVGTDIDFGRYFGWSFIPIAGPFVNAAAFDPVLNEGSFAFHVVMGLLQTAGFLMALLGTIIQEEVTVMRYALDDSGTELAIDPIASPQMAGATATLTF